MLTQTLKLCYTYQKNIKTMLARRLIMYIDRDKINVAMARKSNNIAKLAEVYGVSAQRMRTILNSRKDSTATAGRLPKGL